MNTRLNLSTDLAAVADALEPVTLCRAGSTPGGPGTPIAHALRRAVATHEATAADGQYTAADVIWHLPAAELPVAPAVGDTLCDGAGNRWTVRAVARTTLDSRWRCTTRCLAIAHRLDDTISVLKAEYVKSTGGAAEPVWRTWLTGVRARIQPTQTELGEEHASRQSRARYTIYVEQNLSLNHTHRIQDAAGTVYKILSTAHAAELGALETIGAEVTPWP